MRPADQIDEIVRRATAEVAAASRQFSRRRHDIAAELAEHVRHTASPPDRLRADLEAAAADGDTTPGVLLPADMAEASPHLRRPSE